MHHLLKPSLKTVAPSLLLLALVSLCTQVSSLSPIFSGKDASEIRLFFSFHFLDDRQPSTFPLRREYLVYARGWRATTSILERRFEFLQRFYLFSWSSKYV